MDVCKEKWEKKPNDCNVPIPVVKEVVLDYQFLGACFLHDLCYLSWDTERKDCDDWFLHNMKKTCSVRMLTRPFCVGSALTVDLAVRGFGRSNFEKAKNWTKVNCISEKSEGKSGPTTDGKPTTESPMLYEGSGSGSGKFGLESGFQSGSGSTMQPEGNPNTESLMLYEGSGSGSGLESGSGSTMQPNEQSIKQTKLEQFGKKSLKPQQTEPK